MKPWSDDVFAEIERAGHVQLNARQRRALQAEVERYVSELEFCQAMGGDGQPYHRKWLNTLIKNLDATILALEAPSGVKISVFRRAGLLPLFEEFGRLKSLRESCVEERKELGRQGRKTNFRLQEVLEDLEFIFRDAGGVSSAVSRPGDRTRKSPFIDFAWAVLLQIPGSMRPETHQALAVKWERIRQKATPSPLESSPHKPM